MNTNNSKNVIPITAAGVAVCCGLSALLATAIGTTLLGIAVEAWVLVGAGLLVVLFLAIRHTRTRRS